MPTVLRVFALGLAAWVVPVAGAQSPELAAKARDVFQRYCYRCHGKDGANEGGFNYVIDLPQLVQRRKVVAGVPQKSKLLGRLRDADDPMPPAEVKPRPSQGEIEVIEK